MRIAHVITALVTGGAQSMLVKLIEAGRGSHEEIVVSLVPGGGLWDQVAGTGASVFDLGMAPGRPSATALWRLGGLLRELRPDLIHGWMYHSNIAALLAARAMPRRTPVLWNIRHSLHDLAVEKRGTKYIIRAGAWLSPLTSGIVFNSSLSAEQHRAFGYCGRCIKVIPNGFDVARFRPDEATRRRVREQLGVDSGAFLIGHIARHHPMKDHEMLLAAARTLLDRGENAVIVMAGEGIEESNSCLQQEIATAGMAHNVLLLGERKDMPELMAALDVLVLCSAWGEGFPNVLGEAMATAVPCIATDVGDCSRLLHGLSDAVPVGDVRRLAERLAHLIATPAAERSALGQFGRERVIQQYTMSAIAQQYYRLYAQL